MTAADRFGLRDVNKMWLLPAHFQYGLQYRFGAAILAVALSIALPAAAQEGPQDLHAQPDASGTAPNGASSAAASATSQGQPAKKPPKPYGGGSPLDVLMHTKLWEVPPEAKPFVKESRVPKSTLSYQPTIGKDPVRPKILNSNGLKSLEGELDQAGAHNEKAADVKNKNFADVAPSKAVKVNPRKGKVEKAGADKPIDLHVR